MNIAETLPRTAGGRTALISAAIFVVTIELSNGFLPIRDPLLPWAAAFIGTGAIGVLSSWNRLSMGLTFHVFPSWKRWVAVSAAMATIVLAVSGLGGFAATRGHDFFALCNRQFPPITSTRIIDIVLAAPLLEEITYRLVLVSAAVSIFGEWPAIAIGGLVFAGAHWFYGVQGPDNVVAGFLFSWAYLKSRTLVVPILMHAGGNLAALVLQHYIGALRC